MSDSVIQVTRTLVQLVLANFFLFLAERSIELPAGTANALETGLAGLIAALVMVGLLALERRFPWVGVLFGAMRRPVYPDGRPTDA